MFIPILLIVGVIFAIILGFGITKSIYKEKIADRLKESLEIVLKYEGIDERLVKEFIEDVKRYIEPYKEVYSKPDEVIETIEPLLKYFLRDKAKVQNYEKITEEVLRRLYKKEKKLWELYEAEKELYEATILTTIKALSRPTWFGKLKAKIKSRGPGYWKLMEVALEAFKRNESILQQYGIDENLLKSAVRYAYGNEDMERYLLKALGLGDEEINNIIEEIKKYRKKPSIKSLGKKFGEFLDFAKEITGHE